MMKEVWQDLGKRPLVVASLGGGERLMDSARRATKLGADLIEIRMDSLKPKERANIARILEAVKETTSCPLIATVRSAAEQYPPAKFVLSDRDRRILFEDSIPLADLIDIEIESSTEIHNFIELARKKGKKVILSHHDFNKIPPPDKIAEILKSFESLGGDVLKVAGMVNCPEDVLKLFGVCQSLKNIDRVFIGMGDLGRISRVAGFFYGSSLTYGYMNKPTAPGQLSVQELMDLCALFYPSFRSALSKKKRD